MRWILVLVVRGAARSATCGDSATAPALASMAVIVMLGPAAAQSSRSWAWCVNQGSTFSADQRINGCLSMIQSGPRDPAKSIDRLLQPRQCLQRQGRRRPALAEYIEAIELIQALPRPLTTAASPTITRVTMTARSPTTTRRSGLTRNMPVPITTAATRTIDKGDYDRAIADYNEAIRLNPSMRYAYNNRGNAYDHKGDPDRAIADLRRGDPAQPEFAEPITTAASHITSKGDYRPRDRRLQRGDPARPEICLRLQQPRQRVSPQERRHRAIADYSEAIRLDPKYAQAYFNRGVETCTLVGCPGAGRFGSNPARPTPNTPTRRFGSTL